MKKLLVLLLMIASPAWAGSTLSVLEFADRAMVPNMDPQMAPMPPLVEQTALDFSGGAVQSSALNAQTRYVRLQCSVRCSIKFETGSSTVGTTNAPLGADAPEYFGVPRGQSYKISVIASP